MRTDVNIETAGCLIWVAPRSFGGVSPNDLANIWMGVGKQHPADLIKRGALLPLPLVQDDGYTVRFIVGELNDQENEEWTGRGVNTLSIPCGEVLVSGVLTPDFADSEFPLMTQADGPGSFEFGCYFKVAPGNYQVEVLSYAPGDLSSGWGYITEPRTYGRLPGLEPEKKPLEYFKRTRPNETPPAWLKDEEDETPYINFVVRLSKPQADPQPVKIGEDETCVEWEFRKPQRCPLGIVSELES